DAAEMLAVGKDLVLQGEKRFARINQIHARQMILQRDVLGADVLLDGQRKVSAPLDRRVVGDDDDLASRDAADAGDDAGPRRLVVVEVPRRERRQLQKRRSRVEQAIDSFADRKLALLAMALHVARAAALARGREPLAQLRHERGQAVAVPSENVAGGIDVRLESIHYQPQQSVLYPQAGT